MYCIGTARYHGNESGRGGGGGLAHRVLCGLANLTSEIGNWTDHTVLTYRTVLCVQYSTNVPVSITWSVKSWTLQRIDSKNEEILQKKDTHRHKLTEIHEAYKREIQNENERHLEDLKVTEVDIGESAVLYLLMMYLDWRYALDR